MKGAPTPLRWAETRALMRSDFERALILVGNPRSIVMRAFWFVQPNCLAMWLYRLSRHLHVNGWRRLALVVFTLKNYLTRIEIPPSTEIGPACLLGHPPIALNGRIGARFTFYGNGGTGGGLGHEDVGGGPGLPVIGDDVVMAVRALVLGPVRIGDGAKLGPSCTVMRDMPPGSVAVAPPTRITAGTPAAGGEDAA
jgi:serine O-acetyltransferase